MSLSFGATATTNSAGGGRRPHCPGSPSNCCAKNSPAGWMRSTRFAAGARRMESSTNLIPGSDDQRETARYRWQLPFLSICLRAGLGGVAAGGALLGGGRVGEQARVVEDGAELIAGRKAPRRRLGAVDMHAGDFLLAAGRLGDGVDGADHLLVARIKAGRRLAHAQRQVRRA